METEKDLWFWIATLVSVIAMFAWAVATTINAGDAWVPWAAVAVFVLAISSVPIRVWLRARNVVWTKELKQEQRRRVKQQSHELLLRSIPTLVIGFGTFLLINLARAGWLPQWVGSVQYFVLLVGWLWLWRVVVKSRV